MNGKPRFLRAGVDTLDVAFQVILPAELLGRLRAAQEDARTADGAVPIELANGRISGVVEPHGQRGGYAFVLRSGGYEGIIWTFKDSLTADWNARASPRSAALTSLGPQAIQTRLFEELDALGIKVTAHAVSRIDYAMDFAMPDSFEPVPEQFVAHGNSTVATFDNDSRSDALTCSSLQAHMRGRMWETVRVGKMPGAQVLIYDKRTEARQARRLPIYLQLCGLPADDRSRLWRVELRAGRDQIRQAWRLKAVDDMLAQAGERFHTMSQRIRYLGDSPTTINVTRQTLHPLWQQVQAHLQAGIELQPNISKGLASASERNLAAAAYRANILGNLCGLAATCADLPPDEALRAVLQEIDQTARNQLRRLHPKITQKRAERGWQATVDAEAQTT